MAFYEGVGFFKNNFHGVPMANSSGDGIDTPLRQFVKQVDHGVMRIASEVGLKHSDVPLLHPTKNIVLISDRHIIVGFTTILAGSGGSYDWYPMEENLTREAWSDEAVTAATARALTKQYGWEDVEAIIFDRDLLFKPEVEQRPIAEGIARRIVDRAKGAKDFRMRTQPSGGIVYNMNGPGSRVAINSIDSSTNIVNVNSETLFREIARAITTGVSDQQKRDDLLERVRRLETAQNTPAFGKLYAEFVGVAADHITLLTPFLPALTQFLGSG